eukprot:TRINITY_DN3677_c0_g1_i2.p1 TRINITY_DN3677_c0_g1~~TRINITY_DN3677_c0_g1_i2.p1  ORF type:complete len:298 (-),score=63.27 TRINITY_DN3677_c0_g1_i2:560-1366(-)
MLRSLVGSEMCIRDRYQRRVRETRETEYGVDVMAAVSAGFQGFAAGGLHAITGADHLAALLPGCMGKRWWISYKLGLGWGFGHGLGAILFGCLVMLLKAMLLGSEHTVVALQGRGDAVVGLTLVLIGLNGVRKAKWWHRSSSNQQEVVDPEAITVHPRVEHHENGATVSMGIVHGFTGTGHLLGVFPALTLPSLISSTVYLAAFCTGTFLLMALFTALVGELSMRAAMKFRLPNLPQVCGVVSSVIAILMGVAWIVAGLSFTPETKDI